jgi:hypothetical protein
MPKDEVYLKVSCIFMLCLMGSPTVKSISIGSNVRKPSVDTALPRPQWPVRFHDSPALWEPPLIKVSFGTNLQIKESHYPHRVNKSKAGCFAEVKTRKFCDNVLMNGTCFEEVYKLFIKRSL